LYARELPTANSSSANAGNNNSGAILALYESCSMCFQARELERLQEEQRSRERTTVASDSASDVVALSSPTPALSKSVVIRSVATSTSASASATIDTKEDLKIGPAGVSITVALAAAAAGADAGAQLTLEQHDHQLTAAFVAALSQARLLARTTQPVPTWSRLALCSKLHALTRRSDRWRGFKFTCGLCQAVKTHEPVMYRCSGDADAEARPSAPAPAQAGQGAASQQQVSPLACDSPLATICEKCYDSQCVLRLRLSDPWCHPLRTLLQTPYSAVSTSPVASTSVVDVETPSSPMTGPDLLFGPRRAVFHAGTLFYSPSRSASWVLSHALPPLRFRFFCSGCG
jgi:hypothetical protein